MNNKNKFTKDMTFTSKLGIAIETGIGSIMSKCLNKYDEIVIDNMRCEGYSDEEILYYFETGKTYAEAKAEEEAQERREKEIREKSRKEMGWGEPKVQVHKEPCESMAKIIAYTNNR